MHPRVDGGGGVSTFALVVSISVIVLGGVSAVAYFLHVNPRSTR